MFSTSNALAARMLSDRDRAALPDEAGVEFYREHGWWVSPPCLDAELLDRLARGIVRYNAGERDRALVKADGTAWADESGDMLRRGNYLSLQVEECRAFVHHPLLAAIAARLAQTAEIRLFHDQIWDKAAGDAKGETLIGWHTDKTFWKNCTSSDMLTAWIPLQDCVVEMGPLAVVDGSHRWPGTDDFAPVESAEFPAARAGDRASGIAVEPVILALRRGQASFHHSRTIHGSGANRTNRPRTALCIHYQDADNAYGGVPAADGTIPVFINDRVCARTADGVPDYADPVVCPRLWPPV